MWLKNKIISSLINYLKTYFIFKFKVIRMNFLKKIKKLEEKGIVSRKPHPVIPFIIGFISLAFGISVSYIDIGKIFSRTFFFLSGFSFIFAVLHLIVVKILKKN